MARAHVPPNRKTVHNWHEAALRRATAAATWLNEQPQIFVARQLGHRSVIATEEHYRHLETGFMSDAAARTEARLQPAP